MISALVCAIAIAAPAKSITLTSFESFGRNRTTESGQVEMEWNSAPISAPIKWKELVPSWNPVPGLTGKLEIQIRALYPDSATKFYSFGIWTSEPQNFGEEMGSRTSLKDQKDDLGDLQTDTLVLFKPATLCEVKIRWTGTEELKSVPLKALTLNFASGEASLLNRDSLKDAWGVELSIPTYCQGDYPNGGVICSPTSTAMVLNYWGESKSNDGWKAQPTDVVKGVYDHAWKGTGNWIFTAAYVGSMEGMRAGVHRLGDLRDLETLIANKIPVVCSVSYGMLKGKPEPEPNDGHLVVLRGFTKDGNPIFNDPGRRDVRQVYKRADFQRAWKASTQTVYLIHPESVTPPALSIDN